MKDFTVLICGIVIGALGTVAMSRANELKKELEYQKRRATEAENKVNG